MKFKWAPASSRCLNTAWSFRLSICFFQFFFCFLFLVFLFSFFSQYIFSRLNNRPAIANLPAHMTSSRCVLLWNSH
jgi:hypothetical protein